jgi:methionyl-tRNA synthetase
MNKHVYLSTTIPYVNGDPHIGHALEYIQSDTIARYHRLIGNDVFFLSGTDENSLKNVQAAEKAGKATKDFIGEKAGNFLRFRETLNISFDDFIRTTEERHLAGAQKFWQACDPNDLYKKKYRGLYCVGCEAFYTEDELVNGLCPDHKVAPEVVEEENWFFKLSNYQKQIEEILEKGLIKVYPEYRLNETLAFVKRGLEDFSISRSVERAHGWGVPVPGDEAQIMYVWFDALTNYITALDYAGMGEKFNTYWVQGGESERQVLHVLGKGVSRFHLVYWIGMLLSAKVPLPTEEFIHGYITVNGEKMSKSIGNVINPHDLVSTYGTDPVRYYFLGAVSPGQDGDFSDEKFREFYTAHLANGIGNLTSRILTMIEKYSDSKIPAVVTSDRFNSSNFWSLYREYIEHYQFDQLVFHINELVKQCDSFISETKPWELAKKGEDISGGLYQLVETLRHIALALLPIVPGTAEKILTQLGIGIKTLGTLADEQDWGKLEPGARVTKGEMLFPRLESSK